MSHFQHPIFKGEPLTDAQRAELLGDRQSLANYEDAQKARNEFARKAVDQIKNCEAVKFDDGKAPLSLLPRRALEEEALVLAHGAKKYGTHNWRKGMKFSRLADACLRHIYAFLDGEDKDEESGLSHLAHARCCLAFLLEYEGRRLGTDDRFAR